MRKYLQPSPLFSPIDSAFAEGVRKNKLQYEYNSIILDNVRVYNVNIYGRYLCTK